MHTTTMTVDGVPDAKLAKDEETGVREPVPAVSPADHQTLDKDLLLIEKMFLWAECAVSRFLTVTGLCALGKWISQFAIAKVFMYGSTYQINDVAKEGHQDYNSDVAALQSHAEVFDWRTERLFSYAQVSPCCTF